MMPKDVFAEITFETAQLKLCIFLVTSMKFMILVSWQVSIKVKWHAQS